MPFCISIGSSKVWFCTPILFPPVCELCDLFSSNVSASQFSWKLVFFYFCWHGVIHMHTWPLGPLLYNAGGGGGRLTNNSEGSIPSCLIMIVLSLLLKAKQLLESTCAGQLLPSESFCVCVKLKHMRASQYWVQSLGLFLDLVLFCRWP